jgi:thiosulfate/3-mercaptopyruvate sulfurtransferase
MFKRELISALLLATSFGSSSVMAQSQSYANPDLLVSAGALTEAISSSGSTGPNISGKSIVIVDVRPAEEFRKGHIPGAINVDPNAVVAEESPIDGDLLPSEAIGELFTELGITHTSGVVFYDQSTGLHAARMFWVSEYLGHTSASVLNGGLKAWIDNGGELSATKDQPPLTEGVFRATEVPRRYASADWLLDNSDDANTVVIDVRPSSLYDKGHIPWAVNIPWKGNVNADGTMKSGEELAARFKSHGIDPGTSVAVHCQSGLASSHSYFALRLIGHPRVRVYHRSWSEWGNAEDLPKEVSG